MNIVDFSVLQNRSVNTCLNWDEHPSDRTCSGGTIEAYVAALPETGIVHIPVGAEWDGTVGYAEALSNVIRSVAMPRTSDGYRGEHP